jgi:tetratricopeptide (TPR) repeat protein
MATDVLRRTLRLCCFFVACFIAGASGLALAKDARPPEYEQALELIHSFGGSGDGLRRAMALAAQLAKSHPKSGYAQVLQAELLSTWQLNQDGEPPEVATRVIQLTNEAQRLDANLAQLYVARARALLRTGNIDMAGGQADVALNLEPTLSGAIFMRGDVYRNQNKFKEAETWYLKFIEISPSKLRQSNGYYWIAKTFQNAAMLEPAQRPAHLKKAQTAFLKMIELDPEGPWRNVNYAIFLNNDMADFEGAERYAQKALSIMEFPMARFHLAIARYQKIAQGMKALDDQALLRALRDTFSSTSISFPDALEFAEGCDCTGILSRLQLLDVRQRAAARAATKK